MHEIGESGPPQRVTESDGILHELEHALLHMELSMARRYTTTRRIVIPQSPMMLLVSVLIELSHL